MPSRCSSVDLPAPDGPMMDMNSPSFTSALMRRNTKVLVGPCSKYFSTLRKTIMCELIRVPSLCAAHALLRAGRSLLWVLAMQDAGQVRQEVARQWTAIDANRVFDANRTQSFGPMPGPQ